MKKARKLQALEFYDRYQRLCIERPELAMFTLAQETFNHIPADEVWDHGSIETERYLWFVSYALEVLDNLFEHWPSKALEIEKHVFYHALILSTCWAKHWREECTAPFVELVDTLLERNDA